MHGWMSFADVLKLDDTDLVSLHKLLGSYGIALRRVPDGAPIPGSYWGEPEAGVFRKTVFARGDTPLHSVLHESCHIICMDRHRRNSLEGDAGGDDLEEAAVCYLQVLLAGRIRSVGSERLMTDMDAWGYSFRLGSTARWFRADAADARNWLQQEGLLDAAGELVFRCRAAPLNQEEAIG